MAIKVTKSEPSFGSETNNPLKVERWLRCYQREGEELVGEIKLEGLTVSQLKQLFTEFDDDPLWFKLLTINDKLTFEKLLRYH